MSRIMLEREIGGKTQTVKANNGQWIYWTWSPDGGEENRFEYVAAPTKQGMILANRPDRSHPFYPFVIRGIESGQGIDGNGSVESFTVRVFNDESEK